MHNRAEYLNKVNRFVKSGQRRRYRPRSRRTIYAGARPAN